MRLDDDLRYFETQEFKDILAKYETAREAGSPIYMDADELTDVAEYYALVAHDDHRADQAVELARQLHPEAVDPQIFQARQLMLAGDNQRALEICNAISDQQHREVYFLRAELMVRDGRNTEASNFLLDRSEEVTEDRDYFLFDSAYIFIDYHDSKSASVFAELLEQMAPKWFKTWELQADICLAEDNNEKALTYIEQMLDKDPFYLAAWNWRAEAYCGLQDFNKACESTDFALAVEPRNERALELKAWVLMRQGNLDEAHELYSQLRQMNPDSEIHCLYDSFCLFDKEQYDEAQKLIERAEELADGMSQEQTAIYEHHAHILSVLGNVDEALHYVDLAEKAAQADEAKEEDKLQDFDFYRARVYADNGYSEQALHFIRDVIERETENLPDVIMQSGQIFVEAGDYSCALEFFCMLMENMEDEELHNKVYPYLALCYHELDNSELCLKNIKLAVEHHSPDMQELLGYIFAEGVQPAEYYDYYYYRLYGQWPTSE